MMKKMKLWVTVCCLLPAMLSIANPSKRDEEKVALQKLLQERESRFGDYSRAATSKSGFFGNKTRNDLRKQVDVLTEIIKTDNRIISLLKNFLDYRTFQRTELIYSQAETDEKMRKLDELTTSLSDKLLNAEAANRKLRQQTGALQIFATLLAILVLVLGYLLWKCKTVKS